MKKPPLSLLLLAMSVAVPAIKVQASSPVNMVPVATAQQATAGIYTTTSAKQQQKATSHPLSFTEMKSHKAIVKKYPFLKGDIAEVEHDDAGETTKTTISIATFHDKA